MFITKAQLLGFPSGIFWAILAGHAYTLSTETWDIEYFIFFASIFMAIFCFLAMYALRTKKEEDRDGEHWLDKEPMIDEIPYKKTEVPELHIKEPSNRLSLFEERKQARRNKYKH